jgi:hypothetical protein
MHSFSGGQLGSSFVIPLQIEDYSHYSNKHQRATTPIPTRTFLESLVQANIHKGS